MVDAVDPPGNGGVASGDPCRALTPCVCGTSGRTGLQSRSPTQSGPHAVACRARCGIESVHHNDAVVFDSLYPLLAELVKLVVPPTKPIVVDGDWHAFAAINGFDPPSEWVALLGRYGYCSLGGEAIQLRDPFPPEGSFIECSEHERRELRGWISIYEWYPRWPIWPDRGGFLPWADLRDGSGEIGWLTVGSPESWRVAVLERGGRGTATGFGTLEYLLHLARHIDDVERFSRQGLGWMDDQTTIPYRPVPWRRPPTHEPLEVTFEAIPHSAHDEPRPDDIAERRAWFERAKASSALTRHGWQQRWDAAQPVLDRAAADGVHLSSCGFHGHVRGWVHPTCQLRYPLGREAIARQVLIDLAAALGTAVHEVRNLDQELVWTDLTDGHGSRA